MNAWTFQDHRQKQKLGNKAPWSVGWIDPEGRRRSKRIGSRSMAKKYARKVEGELAAGLFKQKSKKSWKDFRQEYEEKVTQGLSAEHRRVTEEALDRFERLVKPSRIESVNARMVADFVAKRRLDRGSKKGSTVSPATINKQLRCLKSVFRIASEWGYLLEVPAIHMLREPQHLKHYVKPDHFALIYESCSAAVQPNGYHFEPADWWRAILSFCYMTGWRIGEPLALRDEDLDLEAGTAITRAANNKGKRDELVPLHPVVIEHLLKIRTFSPLVFPWNKSRRALTAEFHRIQEAAGIHLPCNDEHEHTAACHLYGFHDLRRGFATVNVDTLSAEALQRLMRHKSYTTTQRYINMAGQLKQSLENLHVPDVLRKAN